MPLASLTETVLVNVAKYLMWSEYVPAKEAAYLAKRILGLDGADDMHGIRPRVLAILTNEALS